MSSRRHRRAYRLPSEVKTLHGLLVGLEAAETFEEIFRALAEALLVAVDRADEAWVSMLDAERAHLSDVLGYSRTGLVELDATLHPLSQYPRSRQLLAEAAGWAEFRVTSPDLSDAGRALAADLGWRSMVEFPLVIAGRSEALVEVSDHSSSRRWAKRDLEFMNILVFHAGAALRNATLLDRFRTRAERDPLTGLLNRSSFDERLEHALREAPGSLAVAFIDLDGFKAVNDRLGHAAGDARLCRAARAITGACRDGDFAARVGGDEFAVALVTEAHDLGEIAARFDRALREAGVAGSVGAARSARGRAARPAALLQQADLRMLAVKAARRPSLRAAS
ncbi:MAG TPA: GGDEF domain-containing protein [Gaiellales bacterium]|nr:GGDEF domain-containing protein [Gaiellales bacterium]